MNSSSVIEPCNLELETSGSYIDNQLTLEKYLEQGCATDAEFRNVARCIRPLVEGYLMLRFPGKFLRGSTLGKMIEIINGAVVGDRLALIKSKAQELNDINVFARRFHHGEGSNPDSEPINDTELKGYVDRALNIIFS